MDVAYYQKRWYVAFAQLARTILHDLGTYPPDVPDVTSALDSLEYGLESDDPLIIATHELVEECVSDIVSQLVIECMSNPKTKRRCEKKPRIDYSNIRIRHGYPYDMFVLCGGLES